jgi:hypothetical protein
VAQIILHTTRQTEKLQLKGAQPPEMREELLKSEEAEKKLCKPLN